MKKKTLYIIALGISILASCFTITLGEKNIIEAENTIISALDLENTNIIDTIPFSIIYQIYNRFCDSSAITSAKQDVSIIQDLWSGNIQVGKYVSIMDNRFSTIKNLILSESTTNENIFCQNKYILYNLLEITQKLYFQYLDETENHNSANIEATDEIKENKDEKEINNITLINNTSNLTAEDENFVILANDYIQSEIANLIKQKFLNEEDLSILNKNITINYTKSCSNTKGEFHMLQSKNGSSKEFKSIELNLNICHTKSFFNNFENYVKQIFIHEIAHYIFAFKDDFTEDFTNICREYKDSCSSEDFVSTYAKSNYAEDYADTFAYWYLDNFNGKAKELGAASTKSLGEKLIYFNGLAQRMQE